MTTKATPKVEMLNVVSPGHVVRVDADKYGAMKDAYLKALPRKSPGLTGAEIRERVLPLLPENLFPGGAKAGWWMKGVQLDLEARHIIARENGKPLRWRKV